MLDIYQPLIQNWLARFGAPNSDLNDLSQNVLAVVVRRLPEFEHQGQPGSFRAWMRNICRNCVLEFWRAKKIQPVATGKSSFQEELNQLADDTSELSRKWNQDYDQFVLNSLMSRIKSDFNQRTWKAFQLFAIDGLKASEVAKQMGISENSVFIAKSRVMSRLRSVGKYILD